MQRVRSRRDASGDEVWAPEDLQVWTPGPPTGDARTSLLLAPPTAPADPPPMPSSAPEVTQPRPSAAPAPATLDTRSGARRLAATVLAVALAAGVGTAATWSAQRSADEWRAQAEVATTRVEAVEAQLVAAARPDDPPADAVGVHAEACRIERRRVTEAAAAISPDSATFLASFEQVRSLAADASLVCDDAAEAVRTAGAELGALAQR